MWCSLTSILRPEHQAINKVHMCLSNKTFVLVKSGIMVPYSLLIRVREKDNNKTIISFVNS